VSLHQLASQTNNTKILHLRWPGIVKRHAPNAWNSSSIFDWPDDTGWFRRVNGNSPESQVLISIFDVCLSYTTCIIPHDLQKIVHWAFGADGFPNIKLIAFGDFSSDGKWSDTTGIYCRNDQAEPWPSSYTDSTRSLSMHANFRHLTPDDWWYRELVTENMSFLAACPCETDRMGIKTRETLGNLQHLYRSRHFEIISDEESLSNTDDE